MLLSHPAEPDPPIQGTGGRSCVTRVPGSARRGVGRSSRETAARWQPRGGKQSDLKVARRRQTCKSAAVWPHRQPPNCRDGNLLIATTPTALSGQGPSGEPGGAERSKTLPPEQGMRRWSGCRPGTARVPRRVGTARLGPRPPHTGHCLVHTNLSLPPAKKN